MHATASQPGGIRLSLRAAFLLSMLAAAFLSLPATAHAQTKVNFADPNLESVVRQTLIRDNIIPVGQSDIYDTDMQDPRFTDLEQ